MNERRRNLFQRVKNQAVPPCDDAPCKWAMRSTVHDGEKERRVRPDPQESQRCYIGSIAKVKEEVMPLEASVGPYSEGQEKGTLDSVADRNPLGLESKQQRAGHEVHHPDQEGHLVSESDILSVRPSYLQAVHAI